MKKIYLLAAVAISMFAACSSNEDLVVNDPKDLTAEVPVGFDVYTQRTTRAGVTGDVTTALLKDNSTPSDLNGAGFGVFAYYTDNNSYDKQGIPNFMYNQQVKWTGSAFTYEPVKYWPNEYGQNAVSDDADKVSFFAYAPWVEVTPSTGKPTGDQTWGISLLSRNNATGDPLVKYIVSFDPTESVDLCWGVSDGTAFSKATNGDTQTFTDGMPWVDVLRPDYSATEKLKFKFNHALAKLNVQIDAVVDDAAHALTNALANGTKIYVRSVTFAGFATKGALNLNNDEANKAKWMDYNGSNDLVSGEEVTIQDGRKDGKEGTPGGVANNEKTLGLNPDLIQNTVWDDASANPGVTNTPVNLFNSTTVDKSVYVIPTGDPVKITIVYDVETADGNLATYLSDQVTLGSSIENRIWQDNIFTGFENGKAYTIKLHLGMNSVKFDADVTGWDVVTEEEPDLPANNN